MSGDQVRFDAPLPDLWDDEHAAPLDDPGLLLYRSNLLGSDLRITNFGGGNTSAKLTATDPLTGAPSQVLWVKGSGGDIGSMKLDGFSTLYLDKLIGLKSMYRSCSRRRSHCDRRQRKRRSAHARDLRRRARLFAVAAAGLRPGAQAWRDG
jgi:rhamnose utilization protein RhaD (predicted bifunctional aldolase and dehydrogenase)